MPLLRHSRQILAGVGTVGLMGLVPLGGRLVVERLKPADARAAPSYLPSLEAGRERLPFEPGPIADLRDARPGIVVVGDSMAGRIDERHLAGLAGTAVHPVLMNATGSAYWYLVLKNYVVASGVQPSWVLVFFRDTNLTDVSFRLDGPYRQTLDLVARDTEPELDRVVARRTSGVWSWVHGGIESAYRVRSVREWIEPRLNGWPARLVAAPGRSAELLERVNATFGLEEMRSMAQADLSATEDREADFARHVDASVLPLMLDLASRHRLRLCFVRSMRRPTGGEPPPVSAALARYMVDLEAYVRSRGAFLIDDHDDPDLAKLPYADGDHISRDARVPYTDRFWSKLRALAE